MPELAVLHASDTEEVSKVIVPDADVYEEEAVGLALLTPRIGPPDVTCKYSMYEL